MKYYLFALFILSIFFNINVYSQTNPPTESQLLDHYKKETNPVKQAFSLLLLVEYYNETNEQTKKEETFNRAIEKLKSHGNTDDIIKGYSIYLNCLSDNTNETIYLKHAQDLLTIANNCNDRNCKVLAQTTLCEAYLLSGKVTEAVEHGYKANASAKGNSVLSFTSLITLGNALRRDQKPVEAFNTYWDAYLVAVELENDSLSFLSFDAISNFYSSIHAFDSAKVYKFKQLKIVTKESNIDSTTFMQVNMELAGIEFKMNLPNEAENKLHNVIRYSTKHNLGTLKSNAFQFFRNHYITNNNLLGIKNLYDRYPGEYEKVRTEDSALFYRIQAFIFDANNSKDSANTYYRKSIIALEKDKPYLLHFMEFNFANFLIRDGKINDAINFLKRAYNNENDNSNLPFLIKLTSKLDSLYILQANYDSAYRYQKLHEQYSINWVETVRSDEILRQSILKETEKREIINNREAEKHSRIRIIEYTAIVITLFILFIVLSVLGSFSVSKTFLRITNFIVFIFLFELIILLIEEAAYAYLHGSPLKMLSFRILVVGALSPLHHWMEEKVLHYFNTHKLIDPSKINMKTWLKSLFTKKVAPVPSSSDLLPIIKEDEKATE